MARLGCPKERSLHAKGLTPRDLDLQSPWHPPERRSSRTRFIRRYAPWLRQMLLLRRINAIRFFRPKNPLRSFGKGLGDAHGRVPVGGSG